MRHPALLKSVCLAALVVVVGVACAFWFWPTVAPTQDTRPKPMRPSAATPADAAVDTNPLLGDSRCRLHRGAGAARDAAVAMVTADTSARFVVLDGSGPVFAGQLRFPAERALLGRRADGALAVAFGGGDHARLQVLLDGEVVADEHGVADFGLSVDGAEWFVVRRNAEGTREVEQHDIATGSRRSFAARWLRDTGEGLSHTGAYARADNQIVFAPHTPDDSSENAHYVRTTQGKTRMVRLGDLQALLLESDSHVYTLQQWQHEHGVGKRVFHWGAKGNERMVEAWWRHLAVAPATVHMFLSDDGAWLGLFGWNLLVLNAETGETALSFPVRGDQPAELKRLRSVLAPDATVGDVGQARDARIAHGVLLVRRTIPAGDSVDGGAVNDVVDAFRMANLRPGAGPDMRFAADDVDRCLVDTVGFPLPLVHVDADGARYVPADTGGFQPL